MGVRAGIVAPGVASGQGGIGVLAAAPGSFSGCSCCSIEAAFFSPIFLFLFFFRGKKVFRLLKVVVALCHAPGAGVHLGTKRVPKTSQLQAPPPILPGIRERAGDGNNPVCCLGTSHPHTGVCPQFSLCSPNPPSSCPPAPSAALQHLPTAPLDALLPKSPVTRGGNIYLQLDIY